MTLDDELRKLIFTKRQALGLSQQQLAEKAGTNQQTIDRIEKGPTKFSRAVPEILRALDIKPSLSRSRFTPAIPLEPIPTNEILGERDLPVFGAAMAGAGAMIVSSDPVQRVRRPENLLGVTEGYGLFVVGTSMVPAYWHGDIAYVHKGRPVRPGDDVVVYGQDDQGNDVAVVKHLRKATDDAWLLTQWNPADGEDKEFELDRRQWPVCHVIVGRMKS